jgi:hypothetical protein
MKSLAPVLRRVAAGVALLGIGLLCAELVGDMRLPSERWSFTERDQSLSSLHLEASTATAGPWTIEDHDSATGARALVNREGSSAERPAVLLAKSIRTRDLTASTRCKSDAQCGLVFRYRNPDNYDVVRFDASTQSVVLGSLVGGREVTTANAPVLVDASADCSPEAWQDLRVDATAGVIRIRWNGQPVIEAHEGAPANSGYAGLWVPATATAYFDELSIEALPDSPRALEVLPLLGRSSG